MEREKLAWAGFTIASVAAFLYMQGSQPRRAKAVHRPRGARQLGSQQMQDKHRNLSNPGTVGSRSEGSRSVISSRRERTNGLTATSNTTFGSKREPSPHVREPCVRDENRATPQVHKFARPNSNPMSSGRRSRRPSIATAPYVSETPRIGEHGTQTSNTNIPVCNTADELMQMPSGDTLRCISPIPRQLKDSPSPPSQEIDLCFGQSSPEGDKPVSLLLPPALEYGVARELMELVGGTRSSTAGPKAWLELYNFVTELPRTVLLHALRTKRVSELLALLPPPYTSHEVSLVHLRRLQDEVHRLLKGEPPRYAKIGHFMVDEKESVVLWCPAESRVSNCDNQFLQYKIPSSDDDSGENDREDSHGANLGVRVADVVEKILLRRRQAKMPSSATQFPESSSLSDADTMERAHFTSFEETEVVALLKQLVKLRRHEAIPTLQRHGADYSFILNLLGLSTNAQTMLERAAVKRKQWAHTKTGTALASSSNPPGPSRQTLRERPHTVPNGADARADMHHYENTSLNEELHMMLDKTPLAPSATGREEFLVSKRLFDAQGSGTRTPSRGEGQEQYARASTTSTVPSPLDNDPGPKALTYGRTSTHTPIERKGDNSLSSAEGNSFMKKNVYDRLYTPPKKTVKPAEVNPQWARTPFNLYV